jgi:hypothetical protein
MTSYKKKKGRTVTTYAAYDAGLPCKNPNCKSHGIPHPNCKCWGEYAEGGDVEPFCSQSRMHKSDCEYFSDGGPVESQSAPPGQDLAAALASMGGHKILDPKGHDGDSFLRHAKQGHSKIKSGIEALFSKGGEVTSEDKESKEKLKKYIDEGGVTKTMDIADKALHLLAQTHPEDSVGMNAAKGRITQYLTNLKPGQHTPKLAFDDPPDDTEQKRHYDKAAGIAATPLSILKKIKDGTIDPDHLNHLGSMYPELTSHLQNKVTERITQAQLNEEKPQYHVRQGLSMLMGTDLSGEMHPHNIQAAQAVFAAQGQAKSPQQGPPTKTKSSSSNLTNASKAYLTDDQARQSRSVMQK